MPTRPFGHADPPTVLPPPVAAASSPPDLRNCIDPQPPLHLSTARTQQLCHPSRGKRVLECLSCAHATKPWKSSLFSHLTPCSPVSAGPPHGTAPSSCGPVLTASSVLVRKFAPTFPQEAHLCQKMIVGMTRRQPTMRRDVQKPHLGTTCDSSWKDSLSLSSIA